MGQKYFYQTKFRTTKESNVPEIYCAFRGKLVSLLALARDMLTLAREAGFSRPTFIDALRSRI